MQYKTKIHCHNDKPQFNKPGAHKGRPVFLRRAQARIEKTIVAQLPAVLAKRKVYGQRRVRSEMAPLLKQGVLALLHSADMSNSFKVWASMVTLAEWLGVTDDRVGHFIRELELAGYLFVRRLTVIDRDSEGNPRTKRISQVYLTHLLFKDIGFTEEEIKAAKKWAKDRKQVEAERQEKAARKKQLKQLSRENLVHHIRSKGFRKERQKVKKEADKLKEKQIEINRRVAEFAASNPHSPPDKIRAYRDRLLANS